MRTDKQFFESFQVKPQWLFELIGRWSPGPCSSVSMTFKSFESRSDSVLAPENFAKAIWVTEVQMQISEDIYRRIIIAMALMQGRNPSRDIEGVIIFSSRSIDPKTKPWASIVASYVYGRNA